MNPDELEDLLRELTQAIQQVMQSGEVLSDDFQGLLAQTLGNLVDRIDQARSGQAQQQPPQPPAGQPPITPAAPSSDAELLWVLAGQDPQAFISYLRTFPTPATQNLLLNPDLLNATIERLQTQLPQGEPPVVDGIPHAPLNSSNVWGANYDQRSGKMRVRFNSGAVYEYDNVPINIFRAFISGNAAARTDGQNRFGRWWRQKSPSIGAAMHQYIRRGNFPYRRLN